MSDRYSHLLEPIKIGNVVFKNRMISSPSRPHFIQGGENHPTDQWIAHYEKKARNGAAVVTVSAGGEKIIGPHAIAFDVYDGHAQHYLSQLTDTCHFYGTKVHIAMYPEHDWKWDISSGVDSIMVEGDGSGITQGEEIPEEEILRITEAMAHKAKTLKEECGFDGCFLHMCYHATLLARSLSLTTNKRTDKYGGSLENRCRWPLMVCEAIKKACGPDFIIEVCITGEDEEINFNGKPNDPAERWTLDDTVEFAKMGEGKFDLLQIRSPQIDPNHPTTYCPEATPWLWQTAYVKKKLAEAGSKIAVVAISGFTHPDFGEKALKEGKCDFVAGARCFISNPEWGKLVQEGRGEDIVPCQRCNKCHKTSMSDPWVSACAVNPQFGIEFKVERMIPPLGKKKRLAIIGGGPTGMRAALYAMERGHDVTIYEKTDSLGGLFKCADNVDFKWTLRSMKEYLIRQIEKSNAHVHLNTEATPEMIAAGDFDAVFACVGSEPLIPRIPGIERAVPAINVYGKIENVTAKNVVIIGGGEIGVELGMYLSDNGVSSTVIEMRERPAMDSTPVHFYSMFRTAWEQRKLMNIICKAKVTEVTDTGVKYVDENGNEQFVEAGQVIVAAGMKAKSDLALSFFTPGPEFRCLGDCYKVGNLVKLTRDAYGAAMCL